MKCCVLAPQHITAFKNYNTLECSRLLPSQCYDKWQIYNLVDCHVGPCLRGSITVCPACPAVIFCFFSPLHFYFYSLSLIFSLKTISSVKGEFFLSKLGLLQYFHKAKDFPQQQSPRIFWGRRSRIASRGTFCPFVYQSKEIRFQIVSLKFASHEIGDGSAGYSASNETSCASSL